MQISAVSLSLHLTRTSARLIYPPDFLARLVFRNPYSLFTPRKPELVCRVIYAAKNKGAPLSVAYSPKEDRISEPKSKGKQTGRRTVTTLNLSDARFADSPLITAKRSSLAA